MYTTIKRSIFLGGACFLAFAAAPNTAHADDVDKVSVTAADLDLQNRTDVAKLHERVTQAAIQVCGRPDSFAMADLSRVWECRKAAIARATPSINALTASTHGGIGDQATTAKAAP